jgi:uncharacterized protein
VIGVLLGTFGVGGSSVATPVLSLLGVPALAAVASPLPGTIPSALLALIPYVRSEASRPRAAAWTLAGAVPATIAGAFMSHRVDADVLLVGSGVVLVIVGLRVVRPFSDEERERGTARRKDRPLLVAASAGVGFLTGLLANGGGFLLVPLYLVVFGLRMRQAAGTSLLVIAVLALPTLGTHWYLGHIDWRVAGAFAAGLIPGSVLGGALAHRVEGPTVRRAFGVFLVAFGIAFSVYRLVI